VGQQRGELPDSEPQHERPGEPHDKQLTDTRRYIAAPGII
jgi:hypothetical protein